jgi:hypothetical protein
MAKKEQNPNTVSVKMRLNRVTSGAIQYVELDDDGNPIANPMAGKFGGIYVRKTTLGGVVPNEILVSVSW